MTGELSQMPPMYSAIKVKGERLYEAARRGETVARKERRVVVNSFEVSRDLEDRQLVHFTVDCSKGTYVRTLAYDLGKKMGSSAHLTALRRESIGAHNVCDAWTVAALVDSCAPMLAEVKAAEHAAKEAAAEAAKEEAIDAATEEKLA